MDKKPEKLVPEVRFKGFTDDWEQHKLGEISFKVNTKNKENLTLPVLSNSAEYGIVNQEDYFDKKIANRTDNYYIVKHNDFVYNPRISKKAPYGPIRRNTLDTKGLMSPLYYVFRINDGNYIYLDYYFKSSKWYKFMYQNGDSGARSDRFAIKDKIFQMMPISMPNTKEQNKIGQLIQTLQKLIDLQQRKLEQLKQLKKAMLQQLFVNKNNKQPILKFKNFRNNWREYKLSEIVNLEDNKRKPVKATERIRGKIPYYGANGIQDYVKGYTHIGKHVLIAEDGANSVDDYPIYFIYSPSWINNHTHVLTAKEEILSSEFLAYALKKINYAKYLVGSGRYKLNAEILKLIPLKIPTMNEQKYIESNLSKIDKLIALQQNKLTQLTALKKYLLQKLFI